MTRGLTDLEAERVLAEILARYLGGEDEIVALSEYEAFDIAAGAKGIQEHPGNAWYDIGAAMHDVLSDEETN